MDEPLAKKLARLILTAGMDQIDFQGHKVIVVVNKVDRPDARVHEVMDEVLELLLDLDATDEQFDSPTIFCSARQGVASYGPDQMGADLTPLFETIVNYIPAPTGDAAAPLQVLVSSIDYNEYVGRIGIGRIERWPATGAPHLPAPPPGPLPGPPDQTP